MADERRLVVSLEARINKLEKGMEKAARSTDRAMDKIERRSRQAGRRMERSFQTSIGKVNAQFQKLNAGLGRLAAFTGIGLGALGASQVVQQLQGAVNKVRELGAEAERAGVSFQEFQQLQALAELENISVDALTDGLKELQLRADEFIQTGKGPAQEAFERLGFSASELSVALQDPQRLFLDIIRRLRELDTAARIRIADEIFGGTGGEQFVQLLDRSQREIKETLRTANTLSDETLEKAERVSERFREIGRTISTGVRTGLINVADTTLDIADNIGRWSSELADFVAGLKQDLGAQLREFLEVDLDLLPEGSRKVTQEERDAARRAKDLAAARAELQRIRERQGTEFETAADAQAIAELERRIAQLSGATEPIASDLEGLERQWRELNREADNLEAAINKAGDAEGLGAMLQRLAEIEQRLTSVGQRLANLTGEPRMFDIRRGRSSGPFAYSGAPPGIGPPVQSGVGRSSNFRAGEMGGPASGIDGSINVLRGRLAHGNVRLDGLDQAAADAAAAVLSDPRFANIMVTSAVRSEEYNRRIPGAAKDSRHLPRMGADAIDFAGIRDDDQRRALAEALREAGFTGFGTYEGEHIHADMGPRRFWTRGDAPSWWSAFSGQGVRQDVPVPEQADRSIDGPQDAYAARERAEAEARLNEILSEGQSVRQSVMTADERYAERVQRLNELLAQGAINQETYNRAVADAQTARDAAVAANQDVETSMEGLEQAAQTVGNAILSTFMSIVDGSGDAEEALKRLAMQMAQMALQGALFGSGPLAGIFGGGLLGGGAGVPGRAAGGPVKAGHPYMVGESGREIFVPQQAGRIMPRVPDMTSKRSSGGGANVMVIDQRSAGSPPIEQQRTRRGDGGEDIRLVIRDEVEEVMSRTVEQGGRGAEAFERIYGLRRRLP